MNTAIPAKTIGVRKPAPSQEKSSGEVNTTKETEAAPHRPNLIPVTHWNDFHPWPSTGGLRHLVFHEIDRKSVV